MRAQATSARTPSQAEWKPSRGKAAKAAFLLPPDGKRRRRAAFGLVALPSASALDFRYGLRLPSSRRDAAAEPWRLPSDAVPAILSKLLTYTFGYVIIRLSETTTEGNTMSNRNLIMFAAKVARAYPEIPCTILADMVETAFRLSFRINNLQERMCNEGDASLEERRDATQERLVTRLEAILQHADPSRRAAVYFQEDPRGCPVFVLLPSSLHGAEFDPGEVPGVHVRNSWLAKNYSARGCPVG